ncbi:substrate-binding periplasmic protein [Sneathiella sp.]|uniref:substrate-binding periplasmic protein n=1 Tax=Sneathiella sp. TaxID=1964365 RepID=UPI0039E6F638
MAQTFRVLSYFIFLWFLSGNPAFSDESVVFACNEFPPYKMENSDSGLPGFDVEFLQQSFKRVGVDLKIQFMPWKRALEEARQGRVNGVCSCSQTKGRAEYLYFSDPLGKASSGVFSLRKNNFPTVKIIDEIGTHSVGVVRGYNITENLIRAHIQNVLELSDEQQGLNVLLNGRIDYYYSYEAPTRYYLGQKNRSKEVVYHELTYANYYSCFSKSANGSEALLKQFNAGLAEIKKDGTYDKILAKYR